MIERNLRCASPTAANDISKGQAHVKGLAQSTSRDSLQEARGSELRNGDRPDRPPDRPENQPEPATRLSRKWYKTVPSYTTITHYLLGRKSCRDRYDDHNKRHNSNDARNNPALNEVAPHPWGQGNHKTLNQHTTTTSLQCARASLPVPSEQGYEPDLPPGFHEGGGSQLPPPCFSPDVFFRPLCRTLLQRPPPFDTFWRVAARRGSTGR